MALAAVSAPYVCQAQDPAGKFKRITQLQTSGKIKEAIAQCDEMLKYFSDGKSRTVAQYGFYEPFFVWKKGELLMASKEYDQAYATFQNLSTNAKYQDKNMRERARRRKLLNGQGYDPYLTASKYYMALCKYQKGVGDGKEQTAPEAFAEAIPLLEEYLDLYQGGKLSKMEKDLKLDGQICFMLMQAYILQPTPDFKKAGAYLERGRKSKGVLPDEMAMAGLSTVINVAMKNPEAIGWVRDIIVSNPQSYCLGPVRMARHGSSFFSPAQNCVKMFEEAMKSGDEKKANDSARSAIALMGMVPNTDETLNALKQMNSVIGTGKAVITDLDGAKYKGADCKKLSENYTKSVENKMQLEAFAVQQNAAIALSYGCHRLAKAGYGIMVNRYPELQTKDKDGYKPLADKLKQAYAQLSRTTGDETAARAIEDSIDKSQVGEDGALALVMNRMIQAQKEERWEDVLTTSEEVLGMSALKPTSSAFLQAHTSKVAALKALKREQEVIAAIEKIFADNVIGNITDATPQQLTSVDQQLRYFLCLGYYTAMREGGAINSEYLDKIQQLVRDYEIKYPDKNAEDKVLPLVYFYAVNSLMLRSNKEDFAPAKEICDKFLERFKGHEYHATLLTVKATIIITTKDKPNLEIAIRCLEEAVDVALKRGAEGKGAAGEALNRLAINGRLAFLTKEDGSKENKEEQDARHLTYFERFWNDVDAGAETNRFALQMSRLYLSAAKNTEEGYAKAIKRMEDTIVREAAYSQSQNKLNPEISTTITALIDTKTEAESMGLDAVKSYISGIAGKISQADKSTHASLTMAVLGALSKERDKYIGDDSQKAKLDEIDSQIEAELTALARDYKPEQLTNDICFTIGENLRMRAPIDSGNKDMITTAINRALPYYREAIKRGGSMVVENKRGLADALAVTGDAANQAEAEKLYEEVINSGADYEVVNAARLGQARVLLAKGDSNAVIQLTQAYLEADSESEEALTMRIMQADAFEKLGKIDEAVDIHYAIMRDYTGSISVSAPACEKMMRLLWARGKGSYADNRDGTYDHTDKWHAWNRGENYVKMIQPMFDDPATLKDIPKAERDAFYKVKTLVDEYKGNSAVREETRREQADRKKYQ